ncbi:hypothetical protein ZIOFF_051573 [Zingiber officinale]|uniref:BHLH domain-containing protein n=1 Tax=Zingiber officinale TaxID=94328 RepID=A0A8J5G2J5_ZINOF|nr:hypothetical protein ZIOFF_051573 [Zingiber officinale]
MALPPPPPASPWPRSRPPADRAYQQALAYARERRQGKQRRERISERLRALQELVPNTNKVLSMSRLGGAAAVAQLVAEIPASVEEETSEGGSRQHIWEKWSTDGTERQVAKLMEEDIGAAMQFLQSKALCMMPISLAMAIYDTQHQSESEVKPEPDTPS